MERQIVRPAGLDLETPGRRDYFVALEHDSIWGDHLIPLTVFVGPQAKAGQGLVSFGSNHGNEYEGPMALRHLLPIAFDAGLTVTGFVAHADEERDAAALLLTRIGDVPFPSS